MSSLQSRLLTSVLVLVILLAGCLVFYQYNREDRLRVISLQNELQSVNDRVYDLFDFKYGGIYNDSCRVYLEEMLDGYDGSELRVTVISLNDGAVLFDSSYDSTHVYETHLKRPEVIEAVNTGSGHDKRKSSVKPYLDYFYTATYHKGSDFVVRSAVPYNMNLAYSYSDDHRLMWFEIFLILIFVLIFYNVLQRMGASQFAKEKLLSHLRISQEGLAIFDRNRHLVLANKLFKSYGDIISAKHLSSTDDIIHQPEFYNIRMFIEKNDRSVSAKEPYFSDKIEKDGRIFSIRCVRFRDKSFEISINDVTLSETQTQLKQQLTQNVAHEFKTPVCSIQGYLETILTNYPDKLNEEQLKHFLQRCYTQSNRLNNLVKDMSQLIEISGNSQYIEKETVNLSSIIKNLQQEIGNKIVEQHITVVNDLPEVLLINGNSSMLYSVFRNLFDNAISYAGSGCRITLSCYRSDSEFYYFSFSDNGVGIPEEHLNRIFERFYRVDKGRSRKLGGTGLGLAIVKNAVILHGGMISARKSDEGGVEFVFTLRK